MRYGQQRADALTNFPAERLRADLCGRFGSIAAAARHAGIPRSCLYEWLARHWLPQSARLRRVLDACRLDLGPYQRFLEPKRVTLVCPACGFRRARRRGELRQIARRLAKQGLTLVRQPDGDYEAPCKQHAPGQRAWGRVHRERVLYDVLGAKKVQLANWIVDEVKKPAPDPEAVKLWKRVMAASFVGGSAHNLIVSELRKPKPNMDIVDSAIRTAFAARQHRSKGAKVRARHNVSIARIIARFSRQPFHLCPLCELATHGSRWHRPCYRAWCRWSGQSPPNSENWPPRTQARGPSPGHHFGRHLRWLLAQRAHQRSRRILATEAGTDETNVRKGALAALRLLPGSWDALHTTRTSSAARKANRTRQRHLPLPEDSEFQEIIERGERDALIRRLHGFDMLAGDIARITGASIERIRGVVGQSVTSIENASA